MNVTTEEPKIINLDFKVSGDAIRLRLEFACIAKDGAGRVDWFTLRAESELEAFQAAFAYRHNKIPAKIVKDSNPGGAGKFLVTIQNREIG